MYGASLRRLAPNLYAVRAGWRHRSYGDPWSYGAVVRLRGPVALISLGIGRGSNRINYRCQRAVLRLLKSAHGIRRAWWIADPLTGRIGWCPA